MYLFMCALVRFGLDALDLVFVLLLTHVNGDTFSNTLMHKHIHKMSTFLSEFQLFQWLFVQLAKRKKKKNKSIWVNFLFEISEIPQCTKRIDPVLWVSNPMLCVSMYAHLLWKHLFMFCYVSFDSDVSVCFHNCELNACQCQPHHSDHLRVNRAKWWKHFQCFWFVFFFFFFCLPYNVWVSISIAFEWFVWCNIFIVVTVNWQFGNPTCEIISRKSLVFYIDYLLEKCCTKPTVIFLSE